MAPGSNNSFKKCRSFLKNYDRSSTKKKKPYKSKSFMMVNNLNQILSNPIQQYAKLHYDQVES